MGNCKSGLGSIHVLVDVTNEKEVYESLFNILSCDNDLTENEDYFRDDTLKLGYENEADRIVKEKLKRYTPGRYEDVATKVSDSIASQEYYGQCDIDFIRLNDKQVVMSFVYGGEYFE